MRAELGEKWVSWLRELPFSLRFGEDGSQLLIVHANPTTDNDHMWPDADDATLDFPTIYASGRQGVAPNVVSARRPAEAEVVADYGSKRSRCCSGSEPRDPTRVRAPERCRRRR